MKFEHSASDKSSFMKFKDGQKVVGVFKGDIFTFKDHWVGGRSERCSQSDDCTLCKSGNKPKFRFHLNFLTQENGEWTAKIFAGGWKIYQTLKGLHESDYNLEKTIVSITRHGSTKDDTVYMILPIKDSDVTPEREAILSRVKLLDLDSNKKDESDMHQDDSDHVPF